MDAFLGAAVDVADLGETDGDGDGETGGGVLIFACLVYSC